MELSQIIPLLFIGEIATILLLYRFVLREWIVDTWETKLRQEGYLIEILDPVITEIEKSTEESLMHFQRSFIGTLGKMTSEAKKLDPMNNMRKAAASGDWTSMLLEYVTNKSGLSDLQVPNKSETSTKLVSNESEFGKFK
tara:strand:+ start:192 stop:611 length:420 start_codon:yes stop_codon:yes gene_type:complete